MTITHQDEFTATHHANITLLDELADEAQAYLQLLTRYHAGEDVTGELYGSVVHLGTHAGLLGERLIDEAELADALDDLPG